MLEAKKLVMRYDEKLALNELSFSVAPGEIFCLLGQNGAGKTTTINIFLGLIKPTFGDALINNTSIKENHSIKNFIAYIPEIVQLYGNLSGLENLDFFSRLAGFKYTEQELSKYLNKANLQPEAFKKKLNTYSKGMRQKVGIAIALAKNASYILMDEPTSGLDPKASVEFATVCKELSANGVGILMATHDIFNAVNIGSKIGIMREGTLVHQTETSKISAQELQDLYIKTI
ncbi:ABC transporter ATP-binding protein [Polaribacter batillariae]|uniref:ABC transporter ATP-binding protein n=1 Tax=Polaribacter batillariae TaxID=2808900 RepID=A0ABX7SVT6_9FLAO|nr:ABC transporter ATP-binding protein [Polaribacter batillariae]QTD38357.1 ABC transporter ATP-binding protein [Polaribacter batillariae]